MSKNTDAVTLLEKNFDVAFAAPDGIKKLRELILSLAMQGKLVPQDEADQPASELLKEIEAEKSRLVKYGKIKASKSLPEIKPDEVPYDLPKSWEWVRIPDCYYGIGNKTNQIQTKDYLESGIYPVIDQGKSFIAGYFNDKSKLLEITKPVVIFGDHTRNIKFIDFSFVIGADGVKILCPYEGIFSRYLYHAIQSYDLTNRGYARHFKVLNEKLIPICSFAEQRRIVAKIDELMARCDELEKLKTERNQKQITVHKAALNRLLTAKDRSDFQTSWHFITQHFSELYSVKENVAELRKAILQLAVMGKLVPQDPNDRSASELLKEIEKEKQKLIKEGKIKASKPLPEIKPDEIPYNLPQGWEWVRLDNLGYTIGGGTPSKSNTSYWEGTIPWVSPKDMKLDYISDCPDHISEIALNKSTTKLIPKHSLLIVIRGMILAHSFPAAINTVVLTINQDMKALCPYISFTFKYLLLLAKGRKNHFLSLVERSSHGTCRLETDKVLSTIIALPPLSEQHRIVAKIDQLMTLCDELEKQIDAAESKQTNLLNSMMTKI